MKFLCAQLVAEFVVDVAGMAFDPPGRHLAFVAQCEQSLPELPVRYRLALGIAPVAAQPTGSPGGDPLDEVLAVAGEGQRGARLDPGKPFNGGRQLGDLVGAVADPAGVGLLLAVFDDHHSPRRRTRVGGGASAVRIDLSLHETPLIK